jgi:hypothetical protein
MDFLDIFSKSHTDSLVDPELRVDPELLPGAEWTAVPPKKDVVERWQAYSSITFPQMKSFADEISTVKNEPLVQAVRTGDCVALSHLWGEGKWSDDNTSLNDPKFPLVKSLASALNKRVSSVASSQKAESSLIGHLGPCSACRSRSVPVSFFLNEHKRCY